ncbi:MAG: twin-arginine translocation signal domain-containing protein, partial [Salinibacter sp.]|uniref:twin-arginine translocation signal domain-containing protein n=1 Tax=Salinibacter sp. TaxID=2065818 RepID=UPI002FC30E8A
MPDPSSNGNTQLSPASIDRRDFVKSAGALTALAGLQTLSPGWAQASPRPPAQAGVQALEPTRRVGNRVEY